MQSEKIKLAKAVKDLKRDLAELITPLLRPMYAIIIDYNIRSTVWLFTYLIMILSDAQKIVKGTDFRQMIDVSKNVIKLQAWFRMKIIGKRLKQSTRKIQKVDPNKDLIHGFFAELSKRKITPEEFFRAIDKALSGKIPVESFIEELISRKLVINRP